MHSISTLRISGSLGDPSDSRFRKPIRCRRASQMKSKAAERRCEVGNGASTLTTCASEVYKLDCGAQHTGARHARRACIILCAMADVDMTNGHGYIERSSPGPIASCPYNACLTRHASSALAALVVLGGPSIYSLKLACRLMRSIGSAGCENVEGPDEGPRQKLSRRHSDKHQGGLAGTGKRRSEQPRVVPVSEDFSTKLISVKT
ncbi:hypothetical protein K466DRAFT_374869 [Polyporus arcularius HHB13444]|uniref:Uncharacterized protein n=1 Tax=Polyporus arcularius HHB13444 TaxID=1314778 RepID=A0A5C3NU54_9APHY|nr:hypothetical protein K466DRAFT_374869 [Polyporus arcularius HHB13444]